mgnify:CR=1 FL=1
METVSAISLSYSKELVLFADNIQSKGLSSSDRTLVITTKAVYKFEKKEIVRRIQINNISKITKNVPPSKNDSELVLHMKEGHDFHL